MQYEIFLEGGQERKTGYYKKRVSIIKSVILKEVINIKAQKSARGRKYLQSGRYNIFFKLSCIFFYFILSYIILFYHFFAYLFIYLFIYLFYLKLTPEKKISPPPPRQGFLLLPPLSRVATSRGNREFFLSYRLWRL